ncbi:hypothetical protein AAC03nite_24620 [Alicyclobacillus acidoterrestris]|nr:hypothetical protein AAC03nite_24620 [Alicyclobacillus acidoterrestris]
MAAGRKTKLTPDLQKRLMSFIAAGNYVEVACAASGISTTTFYRWLEQGEKAKSGIYREFRDAYKQAEAVAEMKRVKTIQDAADLGDWRAALAYLERRYPDRWGRKDRVQADVNHSGEVTAKVQFVAEWGGGDADKDDETSED